MQSHSHTARKLMGERRKKRESKTQSDCNKRDNLYKCCIFITRSNGKIRCHNAAHFAAASSRLMNGGGIPMWSTHCRRPESNSVSLLHIPGIFLVRSVGAASMPIINLPLMPDQVWKKDSDTHMYVWPGWMYLRIWYLRIWGLTCVDFLDSQGNTYQETTIALRGLALASAHAHWTLVSCDSSKMAKNEWEIAIANCICGAKP